MATPLFILQYRKFKSNGVIVSNYIPHPDVDIYIDAIDVETGQVAEKRIIGYSLHQNLSMYKVESVHNEFETFWVSDDHSLIVYDSIRTMLRKISPVKILEDIARYSLVRKGTNGRVFDLIPIKHNVKIEYDPNITVGADFTVEDYYTFSTADGIFVQDTMACYVPLTKEAQQEALEKLMTVKASSGFNRQILKLTNDVIAGIYIATE